VASASFCISDVACVSATAESASGVASVAALNAEWYVWRRADFTARVRKIIRAKAAIDEKGWKWVSLNFVKKQSLTREFPHHPEFLPRPTTKFRLQKIYLLIRIPRQKLKRAGNLQSLAKDLLFPCNHNLWQIKSTWLKSQNFCLRSCLSSTSHSTKKTRRANHLRNKMSHQRMK